MANSLSALGGGGLTQDQIDEQMDKLNASGSASLGGISLSVTKPRLNAALDLLLKAWINPALPEREFDSLKKAGLESLDRTLTVPSAVAAKELSFRLDNYPADHPGKPKTFQALREELNRLTYADVKACAKDLLGLSNVSLVITGDLTKEEFISLWNDRFRSLPRAAIPYERIPAPPVPASINTEEIVVAMPGKPSASIAGAGLISINMREADFPALRLAFYALGGDGNAKSRLWQRLREKGGLSYSVSATLSPDEFDQRTGFSISASVASPDYEKALSALRDVVTTAVNEGLTDEELSAAKSSWLERRKATFSGESGYSDYVEGLIKTSTSFEYLIGYDKRIADITAHEVNAAFKRYVDPKRIVWAAGVGR